MRSKYIPLTILIAISACLLILISLYRADSGKLTYVPPKEADLTLQSATVKNLDVITSEAAEQRLINTVIDTYLKKYYTNPTQNPEVDITHGPDGSTSDNDVYTYTFIVKANGDTIIVTVQRQEGLWIQATASSQKTPSQTYQKYQSLVADPSFEGN